MPALAWGRGEAAACRRLRESQAHTGLLAGARAPPSGRSRGASTIQRAGCPMASTRSWLSGSPAAPGALGPAPPSRPAECARSPRWPRTHSLRGRLQGYRPPGAGHRPPPRQLSSRPLPLAAAGRWASQPQAGHALWLARGGESGWRRAGSRLGWGQPPWLRAPGAARSGEVAAARGRGSPRMLSAARRTRVMRGLQEVPRR